MLVMVVPIMLTLLPIILFCTYCQYPLSFLLPILILLFKELVATFVRSLECGDFSLYLAKI